MATIALKVEIGVPDAVFANLSTVTFAVISGSVKAFESRRGRQHELGRTEAGTARVVLSNRQRYFDPANTSSGYWPYLKIGARIRISATWGPTTFPIFCGYVESLAVSDPDIADSDCIVGCVDTFKALNGIAFPPTPYEWEVGRDLPKMWLRLGESGTLAADSSKNNYPGQYEGAPLPASVDGLIAYSTDKATSFANFDHRVTLPYKTLITGFPFSVEAWVRSSGGGARTKMIFSGNNGLGYSTLALYAESSFGYSNVRASVDNAGGNTTWTSNRIIDDNRVHHVVWVATTPTSWKIYVDGVDNSTAIGTPTLSTFPPEMINGYGIGNSAVQRTFDDRFSGTIDEVAVYPVALTIFQIAAHYKAGTDSWANEAMFDRISRIMTTIGFGGDRSIDTGVARLGPTTPGGTVLGHLQLVSETEGGLMFIDRSGRLVAYDRNWAPKYYGGVVPTFSNTGVGTSVPFMAPIDRVLDDTDIYNRVEVTRVGGATKVAEDSASVSSYGARTLVRSGRLYATDADSLGAAQYLADHYAQPLDRIRKITVTPDSARAGGAGASWNVVLDQELGSQIRVVHQPVGGGPTFNQLSFIEAISHQWSPLSPWVCSFSLSPYDTRAYWVLGTSALGTGTRLYYRYRTRTERRHTLTGCWPRPIAHGAVFDL